MRVFNESILHVISSSLLEYLSKRLIKCVTFSSADLRILLYIETIETTFFFSY